MKTRRRRAAQRVSVSIAFLDVVFLMLMSMIARAPSFDIDEMSLPPIARAGRSEAGAAGHSREARLVLALDGSAMWGGRRLNPDEVMRAIAEQIGTGERVQFQVEVDDRQQGALAGFLQIANDAVSAGLWDRFVVMFRRVDRSVAPETGGGPQ